MVHRIGVFVAPNDFDLTSITREWVHFAVWLRLPFRIRTGKLYRFRVTDN